MLPSAFPWPGNRGTPARSWACEVVSYACHQET